jgi:His-Xaa-Ser system protein HxsD
MDEVNKIEIRIDLAVYDKVAAIKTCYFFQDRFHTELKTETEKSAKATLFPKKQGIDISGIERQFKDELIDQQIRIENEKQFSYIRQLIMEQAFRPIEYSKLKSKIIK